MATLTPTLTLAADAGEVSSDALSFSVTDTLNVSPPIKGLSKKAVAAGGGGNTVLVPSSAGIKYTYIKHTGKQSDGSTSTTNNLIINFGGTAGLSLGPEEFAYFPAQASTEITGISSSSHTVLVECAYYAET